METSHIERIATTVVDAAYVVHCALGPGLLESAYQACLAHELDLRGIGVRCEVTLPISYAGVTVDAGYRIDMVIADAIVVENKSVHGLAPVHVAQIITYLRLSGYRLGFLINWNVPVIKNGIKRYVNNL